MKCPCCQSVLHIREDLLVSRLGRYTLTPNLKRIAKLHAAGMTVEEIAQVLRTNKQAILNSVYRIRNILGVANQWQLAILVYGLGDVKIAGQTEQFS